MARPDLGPAGPAGGPDRSLSERPQPGLSAAAAARATPADRDSDPRFRSSKLENPASLKGTNGDHNSPCPHRNQRALLSRVRTSNSGTEDPHLRE
jgi:hypothetical protein